MFGFDARAAQSRALPGIPVYDPARSLAAAAGTFGGPVSLAAPARFSTWDSGAASDISSQLILTTWPPFLHSCGPRPPDGAMLQFET